MQCDGRYLSKLKEIIQQIIKTGSQRRGAGFLRCQNMVQNVGNAPDIRDFVHTEF
jgi:hypothetical protein